ncbi:MAG: FAD-binding protein [Geminicoccaceae bacterium]|jgi:glycolate oxidase FAD binding subunit
MTLHEPASEEEAAALVAGATAPLRLQGGGTRARIGRPIQTAATLTSRSLAGITLYEPAEMVIGAKSGTPLAEIEATLAERNQMLTFEPMDHRPLFASDGEPTIGAVAAANISGPRRVFGGAARDSLIGVRFVNGRGQIIKNGGRVMKNVTGLDLVKLQAGAYGTLGFLTEVIFKVLPRPAAATTLVYAGLGDARAVALMCEAMGTPFEITGAAHLPAGLGAVEARTLLRLEGFPEQLDYRGGRLAGHFSAFGSPERLDGEAGAALWREVRDVRPLVEPSDHAVWRLSLPPKAGAATVAAIRRSLAGVDLRVLYDWSGGLVWLALPEADDAGAAAIRAATRDAKGHATLVRGSAELRARIAVFEPEPAAVAALTQGVKTSFDPRGLLNPGLMHPGG